METNSQKDFKINNKYFFGERYWEYTIKIIEKIQQENTIEIDGTIRNYIIIQAKFV